ncbi:hypothetical protein [Bacillus wiedmannii]|nr:hypothetical protein [Bacillus wiedmannii]
MKVARTVLSGGKDGDNFKVLPIATKGENEMKNSGYTILNKEQAYLQL